MLTATENRQVGFPYSMLAAAGAINGVSIVKKFGFNLSVTSQATIWDEGGLYVYPASATVMQAASTDVDDTALGTGARTIRIVGLDENWLDSYEDVALNGQTPVATTKQFIRVFRANVLSSGASGGSEGNIYIGTGTFTAGVPVNKYARITDGNNQTLMAIYSVPADKVAFISDYYSNSGKSGEVTVDSFVRSFGGVFQNKRKVSIFESTFYFPNRFPFYLEPKTDVEVRAASSVGTPISAGFDMMLVDKDKLFS